MKKFLSLLLAMTMLLAFAACGNEAPSEEAPEAPSPSAEAPAEDEKPAMGGVGVANPFYTFETPEEAEAVLDFTITLPEVPSWASEVLYRPTTDGTMFEVIYTDDTDEIRMRKAKGNKDISGMYDEFEKAEEADIEGLKVTMKGDSEKLYMATWTDGDFSYFVRNTKGANAEELAELVKAIK